METVTRNVRDLGAHQRLTVEQLVGHGLREDERLIIQVVNGNSEAAPIVTADNSSLPEWCNVYAGLTDAEVAAIEDSIVRSRASRCAD